jgi:hypothetical protein
MKIKTKLIKKNKKISLKKIYINHGKNYKKYINYTNEIYDFFNIINKKEINKIKLDKNEKKDIYKNLFDFFIPPDKYFKDVNEIIYNKEVKNLIPISKILTSKYLNDYNINYFKNYEERGTIGIVKTNHVEKNKINKFMRLKLRFDKKDINKNMNLSRLFAGKNVIPNKTSKYYKKIYKKLLYEYDNNYVPGNILVENLVHYLTYKTNKNIIPKLEEILFYKKVCKIKMDKAEGYELSKLLNIDKNFYEFEKEEDKIKKEVFIKNFSLFIIYLEKELKELQDKINFVHGDFHIDNIVINLNSINLNNKKMDYKNLIKILDFEVSSLIIPMINPKTNKNELKYLSNYPDNPSFFLFNRYKNPILNPYLVKITDNIKLISTILFTYKYNYVLEHLQRYKVNPIIEKLLIEKIGIEKNYKKRLEDCLELFIKHLEKINIKPFAIVNKIKIFKYYHEFFHIYINYNYQLRNYIFFNKIINKKGIYESINEDKKISFEKFEKIIEEKDKNYIQPSFINDPYAYRFTCEYFIKVFK